ncbi:6-carboxytetrahydropterin synthase QueD [Clostridium sp. E02]|uniref:6-carboxytetrahydropterin synthase QueD n=1 Tax=Clostridium sp. E02 TaxID=2487134 RepID=UPI000F53B209|nr:6-carboxytetrahydropterin synthase QueD [Clostridium sp. E02]
MYYIRKKFQISAAHHLNLDYESKCTSLHGHNWVIEVYLKSKQLDHNGMVFDFAKIKNDISGYLDHGNLNELLPDFNPTAENIAKWICDSLGSKCYRVEVQESENNIAIYEID